MLFRFHSMNLLRETGWDRVPGYKYTIKTNGDNDRPEMKGRTRESIEAWDHLLVRRIGLYTPARFP